jgi:hypothetical protein
MGRSKKGASKAKAATHARPANSGAAQREARLVASQGFDAGMVVMPRAACCEGGEAMEFILIDGPTSDKVEKESSLSSICSLGACISSGGTVEKCRFLGRDPTAGHGPFPGGSASVGFVVTHVRSNGDGLVAMSTIIDAWWFFPLMIVLLLALVGVMLVLRNKRPED